MCVLTLDEKHKLKGWFCFKDLCGLMPAPELLNSTVIGQDSQAVVVELVLCVKGMANTDTQHVLIKDVWLKEVQQELSFHDVLKEDLLADHRFAGSPGEHQVHNQPYHERRDAYGQDSTGRIGGTRAAWKTALSRGGCDRLRGPLLWAEHPSFLGSGEGPHPQKPVPVPTEYPAVHRWHHGSLMSLEISGVRGYLEEESNNPLLVSRDNDPLTQEQVRYSLLQQWPWPDKLTGLSLLPLWESYLGPKEDFLTDIQASESFKKAAAEILVGSFTHTGLFTQMYVSLDK